MLKSRVISLGLDVVGQNYLPCVHSFHQHNQASIHLLDGFLIYFLAIIQLLEADFAHQRRKDSTLWNISD